MEKKSAISTFAALAAMSAMNPTPIIPRRFEPVYVISADQPLAKNTFVYRFDSNGKFTKNKKKVNGSDGYVYFICHASNDASAIKKFQKYQSAQQ